MGSRIDPEVPRTLTSVLSQSRLRACRQADTKCADCMRLPASAMLCSGSREQIDEAASSFYGEPVFMTVNCIKAQNKNRGAIDVDPKKLSFLKNPSVQIREGRDICVSDKKLGFSLRVSAWTILQFAPTPFLRDLSDIWKSAGNSGLYFCASEYFRDVRAWGDIASEIGRGIELLVLDNWDIGRAPGWAVDNLIAAVEGRRRPGLFTVINIRHDRAFPRSEAEDRFLSEACGKSIAWPG